jgi:hypothetical protein
MRWEASKLVLSIKSYYTVKRKMLPRYSSNTDDSDDKWYKILIDKSEKNYLRRRGIDGIIILKWLLEK